MSEAFSAALGMAIGLYMVQAMKPRRIVVKQVIVCLKCSTRNPIEYKFCYNCGQSLYLPLQVMCQKCKVKNPGTMTFCGYCGSPLTKKITD